MKIKVLYFIFASMLTGNACGQEWLDGGYVGGSGGNDIAQYFTDPIFHSNPISYQFRPGPLSRTLWRISLQPGALLLRLSIEISGGFALGAI